MRSLISILLVTLLLLIFLPVLFSQKIATTKHNLSSQSSNVVKASTETEICIFCHTPHASITKMQLWNRRDPNLASYTLYSSSTLKALVGRPDGASIKCLSCHDGSVALGNVISRPTGISFGSNNFMPQGKTNLGQNLSNDHPISFLYNIALASLNPQLKNPAQITPPVKLDNEKVQCTSCHDPHTNNSLKFLLTTNESSALCKSCHNITNWASSRHNTSTATWNNAGTNPWQHTTYTTVAKNGCENCHTPHNAGGPDRLLNYSVEESNCLNCHNGSVASPAKNIQTQFNKTYKHHVSDYQGTTTHTPNENITPVAKHVECTDCHNPHQSDNTTAAAPNISGKLKGVRGLDTDGKEVNPAVYEYQICYKCHSTSSWKPTGATPRKIIQDNVALEFDANAISFHPVEAVGKSSDVPSLLSPWTVSSRMYCTDCHSSDTTSSVNPRGPHGSGWASLLQLRYETADNTSYSTAAYALCFKCHNSTSIIGDRSFKEHSKHIKDKKTPCNVCHDPHGVSQTQGTTTNNAHLINFNTNVVSPYNGTTIWVQTGTRKGYCTLKCHGENHNKESY